MRYLLAAFFSGLLLGALAPMEPTYGVSCASGSQDITNSHHSGETCCACGQEDHTVDRLTTSGSTGLACIEFIEVDNVEDHDFATSQCQSISGTPTSFTILVERSTHQNISQWQTDASVGGTNCNTVASKHDHDETTSFTECE